MYVCGPTVYSYAHIGNARPPVVFDVLARLLRRDYQLIYARNVTDVDDKINAAAAQQEVDIGVITQRYLAAYHADLDALGVAPPDIEPRVTDHMPQIIAMIERLIEFGNAYESESHVLFSVASFADYGKLSRRGSDELLAGARIEVAPYKRDAGDFVLWKPSSEDMVGWSSPWGRGRPGWHIECSAMIDTHLGETIDIHGGGQDLVFPHHENELAQSTCSHSGAAFCRFWIHNGFLSVNSEKMAKSIGNVVLVKDLISEYPGEVIRMGMLSAHYRQPLDWTDQLLEDSAKRLDRLYRTMRDAGIDTLSSADQMTNDCDEWLAPVVAALEDDLNTPKALAEIAALARECNRETDPVARAAIACALRQAGSLVGLLQHDPQAWFRAASVSGSDHRAASVSGSDHDESREIDDLVAQRVQLRAQGDYAAADQIRDNLAARGIKIEDGSGGSRWRRAR